MASSNSSSSSEAESDSDSSVESVQMSVPKKLLKAPCVKSLATSQREATYAKVRQEKRKLAQADSKKNKRDKKEKKKYREKKSKKDRS